MTLLLFCPHLMAGQTEGQRATYPFKDTHSQEGEEQDFNPNLLALGCSS